MALRAVECVAPLVLADLPREEMLSRALKQAGHSMLPAAVQPLVEVSEGPDPRVRLNGL